MIEDLYQELIIDHFRNPRHKGELAAPECRVVLRNPLCGDQITVMLNSADKSISEISFTGHGCSISQASASLMSELLVGRALPDAVKIAEAFDRMLKGELTEADRQTLGDVLALEGVKDFPARVKCATLAWEGLTKCLQQLGEAGPTWTDR